MFVGGGPGPITPDVDVGDDVPGITVIEDEAEPADDAVRELSEDGGFTRHRRNVWDIILSWHEIEQLSATEKNKWLAEVGRLFEWLRTRGKFMAVIRDDRFSPAEKLADYNKELVVYKFGLMRCADLVKAQLFRKMLDDNAAQFLDIFVEGVLEAEESGQTFDFGESEEGEKPVFTYSIQNPDETAPPMVAEDP